MKCTIAVVTVMLIICGQLIAAEPSLQDLKAQVATAKPDDRPKLYAKIAELEFKDVENLYAGNTETAQTALSDLVTDCEKAAETAKTTRKHMKKTEITLRKIESRLEAIGKSAAYEDRPPIKEALDRIERARSAVLDAMFK